MIRTRFRFWELGEELDGPDIFLFANILPSLENAWQDSGMSASRAGLFRDLCPDHIEWKGQQQETVGGIRSGGGGEFTRERF